MHGDGPEIVVGFFLKFIPQSLIQCDVRCHEFVGIKTRSSQTGQARDLLGVAHQREPMALALPFRLDRNIDDHQFVALRNSFDKTDQPPLVDQQVEAVIGKKLGYNLLSSAEAVWV